MYAITYLLSADTVLHRAASAKAALETLQLLKSGGATVVRITVTRTGKPVTVEQLQQLAKREG